MFDRTNQNFFSHWWWTVDRYILLSVFVLTAIGVILVSAGSPAVAGRLGYDHFHFVIRQGIFIAAGFIAMVTCSMMSPVLLRRLSFLALVGFLIALILVLVIGVEVKGAQRWLNLGLFSLQPSEVMKPFFVVMTAWLLTRGALEPKFPGFRVSIGALGFVIMLVMMQPDFGMTIAYCAVWSAQVFLAGLSMRWVALLTVFSLTAFLGVYLTFPHVANRVNLYINPESGDNYQVAKSLEAVMQGGLLGKGPGQGEIKQSIPDAHTDFIFAVAAEELGLIATLVIIALYIFMFARIMRSVWGSNDIFVMLATSGLVIMLAVQTIVNMGVAINLLPNTGMTLPFISYGGSSTLSVFVAMGMILSFTRKRYQDIIRSPQSRYNNLN